ncbi:MAG: arylesterase [Pseudomonadota bacterium]
MLSIALWSAASAPRAEEGTGPALLVLGDSISAAYGMSLEEGWVALLARQLEETHPGIAVINASISGDTSAGGLRRLPLLLKEHDPDLVVIELGGNDGLRGYPTNTLAENLTTMATLARDGGAAVLLVPMEIPPNYGPRYTTAFRKTFTTASESAGVPLAPFPLNNIAVDRTLMQDDGIHPTAEAQSLIVESLMPIIEQMLSEVDAS